MSLQNRWLGKLCPSTCRQCILRSSKEELGEQMAYVLRQVHTSALWQKDAAVQERWTNVQFFARRCVHVSTCDANCCLAPVEYIKNYRAVYSAFSQTECQKNCQVGRLSEKEFRIHVRTKCLVEWLNQNICQIKCQIERPTMSWVMNRYVSHIKCPTQCHLDFFRICIR